VVVGEHCGHIGQGSTYRQLPRREWKRTPPNHQQERLQWGGGFTTRIFNFRSPTAGGKLRIRISFEKPYSFQTFISTRDLKIVQK
jgi:hypothetical protein